VDLFVPATVGSRDLALVVVHGGGWNDPEQRLDSVAPLAARLAHDTGLITLTADYRLVREGGVHPEPVRDLRCASTWIGTHATHLGLREPRLIVMGASAGAHLALLAAAAQAEHKHPPPPSCGVLEAEIAAVVAVSAPVDLDAMLHTPVAGDGGREASAAVRGYLGPACAAPSPTCRGASPIAYDRSLPRVMLVHSDGDHLVPLTQPIALAKALPGAHTQYVPAHMRDRCRRGSSMHGFSPCLVDPAWHEIVTWIALQQRYATATRPR
jgi:acetyl esterase/lipase